LRRIRLFRFVGRMTSAPTDHPTDLHPAVTFPEVSPAEAVALMEHRLRAHLARWLPDARVILFGSRARGQARRRSDFDLGVRLRARAGVDALNRFRAAVEDGGRIISKVDIVDLLTSSPALAAADAAEGIVWQN